MLRQTAAKDAGGRLYVNQAKVLYEVFELETIGVCSDVIHRTKILVPRKTLVRARILARAFLAHLAHAERLESLDESICCGQEQIFRTSEHPEALLMRQSPQHECLRWSSTRLSHIHEALGGPTQQSRLRENAINGEYVGLCFCQYLILFSYFILV